MAQKPPAKEKAQGFQPGSMLTIVALCLTIAIFSFLLGSIVGQGEQEVVKTANSSASTPSPPPPPDPAAANSQTQTFDPSMSLASSKPQNSVPTVSNPPPVRLEPAEVDLGSVAMKQKLDIDARLHNTGDKPLTVLSSRANCGCTAVDLSGVVIPPGDSVPLNATFDTRDKPGTKTAQITIAFDGYDQQVRLPIRANVQTANAG